MVCTLFKSQRREGEVKREREGDGERERERCRIWLLNGKQSTVNKSLDGSMYPG